MLITLVSLMVMSIVGLALASMSTQALRLTRMQRNSAVAFNLAESGAERALLWLRQQGSPPSSLSPIDPFGGAVTLGEGTYSVTIDGDDNNNSIPLKRYAIVSRGRMREREEVVELYVQATTFGRYAYFTDYEVSSISNGVIWFKAGEVVDGPAHSNNSENTPFHINYVNSNSPIFTDQVTAAGSSITWNPGQPADEATFQKVFEGGSRGYQLGVNRIELPDSTDRQKIAAWGSSVSFPSTNGVYLNASGSSPIGGVYIRGDAAVEFVDGGAGIQVVQITQGTTRTKITVDLTTNQTVVRRGDSDWSDSNGGGTVTSYSGVPNGVLYSTGNITSMKGTFADSYMSGSQLVRRNAWTVATDLAGNKNVTITGHVQYDTVPDKTRPWDDPLNLRAAALGVVARNIELDNACPTSLTLHGVMLAGGRNTADGSFYNEGWSGKSPGMLNLIGGVIQKKRGPVGTFNSSTGAQSSGYGKNYSYDRRMAVNPPPFFPTTGNYDRLSWTRGVAVNH